MVGKETSPRVTLKERFRAVYESGVANPNLPFDTFLTIYFVNPNSLGAFATSTLLGYWIGPLGRKLINSRKLYEEIHGKKTDGHLLDERSSAVIIYDAFKTGRVQKPNTEKIDPLYIQQRRVEKNLL